MSRFLIFSILCFAGTLSAQNRIEEDARLIIHLLDYMANDYGAAVEDGQVINAFEYQEMQEFASTIGQMVDEFSLSDTSKEAVGMKKKVALLDSLVQTKADANTIAEITVAVKQVITQRAGLSLFPQDWPDVSNGKRLYAQNCVSCHGESGDGNGPSAQGLEPQPTALSSREAMGNKAPIEAYHTIKFGVEGTSMAPFSGLSEKEVWDIAFYVHTLRFETASSENSTETISLKELATLSDDDLRKSYDELALRYWRQHQHTTAPEETPAPLDYAERSIERGVALAKNGEYKAARAAVLSAYLEGVEPVELNLSSLDPGLVQEIELELGVLRKLIEQEDDVEDISASAESVIELIGQCRDLLGEQESSYWLTFSLAASVILREGLEAFLVIIIILSILKRAGAQRASRWVHGGWLVAVALGIAGWFFTGWLLAINGMQRELLEGIVALIAVAFLFYIGFWMHSKTEAKKWNDFVKNKIQGLINRESRWGLAVLSFLVVFREAFESVLFLSAISLEEASGHQSAIGLGVGSAFIVVGALAVIMLRFSARIPISQLFRASSLLLALLSLVLVGKGFHALQEAGAVGITAAPINIRVGLLGIYPTLQTLIAQVVMLVITVVAWRFMNRGK